MAEKIIDHKALFDQMPVIRFLVEYYNDSLSVSAVNKLGLTFFDKPEEKIIGQPLKDLIGEENYHYLSESLMVCLQKKMAVTIPALPALPDLLGEVHPSGFWVNPVYNQDNEVMYLDVIGQPSATDVSVVERERDDALSLLTSIFNASDVGILVFDKKRHVVKMNDSFERIFGWDRKDMLGKDFIDFVTEDEHQLAQQSFEGFLKDDSNHSGEVKIFRKDGTIANTIFTTASLKLSHGRRFQVTTLFDITKRKQMELSLRVAKDQADAANNAKSVFLANMSHELRTPLNAIIGFSEMMVNESFGPLANKKYHEYLNDVFMSATHLLEIINEVLDMSKIESGKIELDERKIDLNTLLQTLTRIMSSRTLKSDISIEEIYQEDLPKIYADPRLLRQIFINLITNSIKYSVDGGVITLQTRLSEKGEIEVVVADHGMGIPSDRIKDAMEPFGQIHDPSTHSEIYQGTGLGLPLAKAMVEMHGGVFALQSVEGEGTTITVSFSKARTR